MNYIKPEIEIVDFTTLDVISASGEISTTANNDPWASDKKDW